MSGPETAESPAERAARDELDRSLVRGVAWTGGVRWSAQALTWLATLYVARVLAPADYGLVGMAAVYLGFVRLVNEFGLGSAIVILRDLPAAQIRQLHALAVGFGAACFAASWLVAEPVARFYGAPEVRGIVVALSAAFLIAPLRTVPGALLERELHFRALALVEGVQSLAGAAATVLLARAGYAYWALVVGALSATASGSLLVAWLRPQGFAWPRPATLRAAVRVSWHILVGRISWYVYSNADLLIAGKLLGKSALGLYAFAFSLASIPVERVASLVASVTPAVFSVVQRDRMALRRYFLGFSEALALVSVPATWGLALVAPEFVPVVLGAKWSDSVAPLQILACYASFRCVTLLLPSVLNVTGQTRFGMWMGVASALVLPLGFWAGSSRGAVGIAAAWLALHPLLTLPNYVRAFRALELDTLSYLRALWPAASASVLMAAAVAGLRAAAPERWSLGALLAAEVALGAAVYALALVTLHRTRLHTSREILRNLRR